MQIDPRATYSLYRVVKNGWMLPIKSYHTAHKYVLEDLLRDKPVLNAEIIGEGYRRSINIKGAALLKYREKVRQLA